MLLNGVPSILLVAHNLAHTDTVLGMTKYTVEMVFGISVATDAEKAG